MKTIFRFTHRTLSQRLTLPQSSTLRLRGCIILSSVTLCCAAWTRETAQTPQSSMHHAWIFPSTNKVRIVHKTGPHQENIRFPRQESENNKTNLRGSMFILWLIQVLRGEVHTMEAVGRALNTADSVWAKKLHKVFVNPPPPRGCLL